MLSDNKLEGALSLGIAYKLDEKRYHKFKENGIDLEGTSSQKHHLLPVPAVFIIGMDGIIKFQYVNPNHRVRVHPDILLAAAKSVAE